MFSLLFARQNRLQGIAGLGDLREVDFRAELFPARAVALVRAAHIVKVLADLLGLIGLHGTGVSLLLRYADLNQHVENLFAFDFQLASQIVDSNLHPPFVPLCRGFLLHGTAGLRLSAVLLDWIVLPLAKTSVLHLPGQRSKFTQKHVSRKLLDRPISPCPAR
jgi:hypothetical protein